MTNKKVIIFVISFGVILGIFLLPIMYATLFLGMIAGWAMPDIVSKTLYGKYFAELFETKT